MFLHHGIRGYNGGNDSVTRILEEGAEITSKDYRDDMGIHLAAGEDHHLVLNTFLEKGIDLNIQG